MSHLEWNTCRSKTYLTVKWFSIRKSFVRCPRSWQCGDTCHLRFSKFSSSHKGISKHHLLIQPMKCSIPCNRNIKIQTESTNQRDHIVFQNRWCKLHTCARTTWDAQTSQLTMIPLLRANDWMHLRFIGAMHAREKLDSQLCRSITIMLYRSSSHNRILMDGTHSESR